jgi:hypothetical protein
MQGAMTTYRSLSRSEKATREFDQSSEMRKVGYSADAFNSNP